MFLVEGKMHELVVSVSDRRQCVSKMGEWVMAKPPQMNRANSLNRDLIILFFFSD